MDRLETCLSDILVHSRQLGLRGEYELLWGWVAHDETWSLRMKTVSDQPQFHCRERVLENPQAAAAYLRVQLGRRADETIPLLRGNYAEAVAKEAAQKYQCTVRDNVLSELNVQ